MKKMFTAMLSVVFIACTMTACGNNSSDSSSVNKSENTTVTEKMETLTENTDKDSETPECSDTTDDTDSDNGNHILVAYFSATGTTKGVAETLADTMSADLFEIVPTEIYTDDDLNYSDNNSRSTIEQNDRSARPEISNTIDDLSQYDTVFIGYRFGGMKSRESWILLWKAMILLILPSFRSVHQAEAASVKAETI